MFKDPVYEDFVKLTHSKLSSFLFCMSQGSKFLFQPTGTKVWPQVSRTQVFKGRNLKVEASDSAAAWDFAA